MKTLHFSLKWMLIIGCCLLCSGLYAQSPDWLWARSIQGKHSLVSPQGVITDNSGNIYITGNFEGPWIIFGNDTLYNENITYKDIFIAKYSPTGHFVWAKSAVGIGPNYVSGITTDSYANIYITGIFGLHPISFDSITLINENDEDIFIAKYDSSGNVIWAKEAHTIAPLADNTANAIASDNEGNIYITGTICCGDLISGTDTLLPQTGYGGFNYFISKLDPDGNFIWTKGVNADDSNYGISLFVDNCNNVFAAGQFYGDSVVVGNQTLFLNGTPFVFDNYFIVKYNSSGDVLWAVDPGGATKINDISADMNGNLYVAGSSSYNIDTVVVGNDTLIGNGGLDAIIIKYNSLGNILWARNFGGGNNDFCTDIIPDINNNIYVTGWSKSTSFTIDNFNAVDSGLFILKFNPEGNLLWGKHTNSNNVNLNDEYVNSKMTFDQVGNIYLVGILNDTIIFGNDTLVNPYTNYDYNYTDVFLAKLSSTINSIKLPESENTLKIYPNPSTGKISITGLPVSGQVQVINSTGQTLNKVEFNSQTSLNITLPESGIYFIRIISGNEVITKKVVVCR